MYSDTRSLQHTQAGGDGARIPLRVERVDAVAGLRDIRPVSVDLVGDGARGGVVATGRSAGGGQGGVPAGAGPGALSLAGLLPSGPLRAGGLAGGGGRGSLVNHVPPARVLRCLAVLVVAAGRVRRLVLAGQRRVQQRDQVAQRPPRRVEKLSAVPGPVDRVEQRLNGPSWP